MSINRPETANNVAASSLFNTSLVCVDAFDDGLLSGRVANPFFPRQQRFRNLMQLLLIVEDLLDEVNFPQAFTAPRRTWGQTRPQPESSDNGQGEERGQLATFRVQILFRQNTSWQGRVQWLEQEREESFRSTLELILLMRGALNG